MKKTILFLLIMLVHFLDVQATLEKAKSLALLGECNAAIDLYTKEIATKESEGSSDVLTLYNDRGDLFFARKQYLRALKDYQIVLARVQNKTWDDKSNLLRGICGSMFCNNFLNKDMASKVAFQHLVEEVAAIENELHNIEWIRTNPVYLYRTRIEKEKIEGSCKKCGEKSELVVHQAINMREPRSRAELEPTREENCVLQCNGYAVAAYYACSRVPMAAVQFLCVGCIFGLEQVCIRCCKGAGFWENCVKSLRRLYHDPDHPNDPAPHPFE